MYGGEVNVIACRLVVMLTGVWYLAGGFERGSADVFVSSLIKLSLD
jgi:hypothetical protein